VQTPEFLQPNVRRQNDFHWTVNGITVVAFDAQHRADVSVLSSQFSEDRSASRSGIGIYAALDFRKAFLVAEDHRGDGDCASYDNRHDRNQQAA
jgi:hypothetical protein